MRMISTSYHTYISFFIIFLPLGAVTNKNERDVVDDIRIGVGLARRLRDGEIILPTFTDVQYYYEMKTKCI